MHAKALSRLLGFVLIASAQAAIAQPASRDEPIAFIGHGAIFGPAGNEIAPTAKFIGKATQWYIDELAKGLTPEQRSEFERWRGTLTSGMTLDEHSKLLLNTRLVDWLLDRAQRSDTDRLRGKNNLLKQILSKKLTDHSDVRFPRGVEKFNSLPDVVRRLADFANTTRASPATTTLSVTLSGGAAYRAECLANKVPVPPDFGPGSAWQSQGIIPKSELFIVRGNDAEVLTWTSETPKGMCVALPRYNVNDIVEADGVICVSQETSKACFWDNQVKDGDPFTFPRGSSQPFSKWAGGSDLRGAVGGVCSDCHAGENPYIIHGKVLSSLANSLSTTPPAWYDPIVRSGDEMPWPENPGPINAPTPCAGCHDQEASGRLPKLSSGLAGYCSAVLRSSIGALAPPLPGSLNAPPSMPQGRKVGKLACTPGLPPTDPRHRSCEADVTFDCTPSFGEADPRKDEADFPAAYKVSCTKEMSDFLKLCEAP